MPFVYDLTHEEWIDDETEPPPPRADQFVYIAASEFGGGRAPVQLQPWMGRTPFRPRLDGGDNADVPVVASSGN